MKVLKVISSFLFRASFLYFILEALEILSRGIFLSSDSYRYSFDVLYYNHRGYDYQYVLYPLYFLILFFFVDFVFTYINKKNNMKIDIVIERVLAGLIGVYILFEVLFTLYSVLFHDFWRVTLDVWELAVWQSNDVVVGGVRMFVVYSLGLFLITFKTIRVLYTSKLDDNIDILSILQRRRGI